MRETTTLERLFRHKAWANEATLAAMATLDTNSQATEVAIRVLAHTFVVDQIFAAHMRREAHGFASANVADVPTLVDLSDQIGASDARYVAYVAGLDEAARAEMIDFTFTDGAPGRMSREEMLMHVISHGAWHRGQIGWMMTLEGADPLADGLTTFLHTAEAPARRRDAGAPGVGRSTVGPADAPSDVSGGPSRLEALTRRMQVAVDLAGGRLSKTLKFNLKGEGFVFIDGGAISNEDKPADLTLSVTIDDLGAIGQGRLAPMAAVMSGRLGVSDMAVGLGLQGKLKALFSHMPPA